MDLLFKRYASPFSLLNGYIRTGRLFDFIDVFIDEVNEDLIFDVWVHKVQDKTFDEFKRSIGLNSEAVPEQEPLESLETTLNDTKNILNNFIPMKGVK